jgi:DNA-binding FadR family transcriptional regulator
VSDAPEPASRLADRVYAELLAFIFEHNLDQGDRLPPEIELCRMTSVSRPILREALTRLRADGLVASRRGAGTHVLHRPDEKRIHHLRPAKARARLDSLAVRLVLEPAAARLAAQYRREQDLVDLRFAAGASTAEDPETDLRTDRPLNFHRVIAVTARNPMFAIALDALELGAGQPDRNHSSLAATAPNHSGRIAEEHLTILKAISRGDADVAETAMRLHLLEAQARLLEDRGMTSG